MHVVREYGTSHEPEALVKVLGDPKFVLPRLFPPVKEVETRGTSFQAKGRFLGSSFSMSGEVYVSVDAVTYPFVLLAGSGKGDGRLTARFSPGSLVLAFDYDGWMNRLSGTFFMGRWFSNFGKGLEEEVRLERVRRKV
ncbi:hypothetical protein HS1genome_1455 [Sulfodiicoccus acidiphilus]|uniref:DUF3211 domain-containing protein n=1 Tax=Sulfodiicoccus acidiphilus TaxID=1670455 RepID=A0A348B4G4_9CREN|nr:DUF3211 domain-containing protein [Sulfodiicoccus acidiphilus]BBD73066.1 hypothetical protein HS1genome_1455 [Sulfodiicoccus acidiphilus]GGU04006.1 hypothetical protein GCM10007116_21010 [Sulfodiicoccus acidiphilus]